MRHRLALIALTGSLAAVMLVAACGEDEADEETPAVAATEAVTETPTEVATEAATPAPSEAATEAPTQAAAGDGPVVDAEISGFSLPNLTVDVGTTVVWTNADSAPHTATASDGSFSSPALEGDEEFRHTFTEAGEFRYICTLHDGMEATVTVQ